ncbi:PhnD/SsuA/transferrin family substrate-binding protein [Asticcacaulis sp. EMRT-3]|uniref:PhnD/SsuA/transferrin family substrate-binding protein n=1 Tax=Asticcacaulis sp. EMRT-3 TaxID=3040349 RepID=UPI0024AFC155|nr:PhnD/SsuA/transferrin family substrate-binding protein [Asticcacaulis sp. EMRT-3]MDI7776000.1 PhnD/SsuA/transferrin family substrate-binding protein [Asticcacaulis sp. EMRT-3]
MRKPDGAADRTKAKAKIGLALLALVALVVTGCGRAPTGDTRPRTEIGFAVRADAPAQARWQPLFDDMARQTGLKIRPVYAASDAALVAALRDNRVQAGWFSNAAGLAAMRHAHGEVFAHTTYPDGTDSDYSLIIVGRDSKLKTINDLLKCDKRLKFGVDYGASAGMSGADMAARVYLFLPHHFTPETCFKTVRPDSPQANIEAVASGRLDAAISHATALTALSATPQGHVELERIKTLWVSPPLLMDVLEYRTDLDPATREKLRSFFLSYGTATGADGERQRAVLNGLVWGPLQPDDDSHFLPQRRLEALLAIDKAQARHDDKALKAAQAQLADIEKEQADQADSGAPQASVDGSVEARP